MGNLSAFVPSESEVVKRIYAWHKKMGDAEPQRGYLGASILGKECDRELWFTFRGCVQEDIPGRIYRLFKTGDHAEPRFVTELKAIGCEVFDVDPQTGQQFEFLDLGGHLSGHMDAALKGVPEAPKTWHVGEFKTHGEKSFKGLVKEGVRASKPQHWVQMQVYMGQTGMKRALYLAVNKNTDELYAERIKFDSTAYQNLMRRARRIIESSGEVDRIAKRADDWRCRFCDAKALCWGGEVAVPIPKQTCKSCCHSTPVTDREVESPEDALWRCEKYDTVLSSTDDGEGCPTHLLLPSLVSFATPEDAGGDGWIEFHGPGDTVWRHGPDDGQWSTKELMAGPGPLEPGAEAAQEEDSGWPPEDSLLARYPYGDSERVWNDDSDGLQAALEEYLGCSGEELIAMEAEDRQVDDRVNATEYCLDNGDFLIVNYIKEGHAAIWRGKE